ncbi:MULTISPECIES: hypothetical protein [unclassified Candidatus Frackibacter]|uniref:hypothetical protein n=1 Tax=unclassified Candidatus Frackibacter TaxID=2648818 RepID=UPI00088A7CF6|nr:MULTISPECIES: hypothetical protein [unclassified Candidatus Frackibacter]SDB98117.1 hypothetical protein SAMN04515661_101129 [Candidatus Frackibacter sp. WG11]SEM29843.1 hypothetical protein SAMN04488698_101130 [Candidatus Frackibacter sp. WG12]SFL34780.1 hypothetical protein SAMN04488699_101131 [Candidatus Frackibacter sp. WG13]
MKKTLLMTLVVLFTITLVSTMAFAATKSVEDMFKANAGCGVSCHEPDSEHNLKNEIKDMASAGKHANVAAMVSNEGPEKCMACHSSNFGKVLHKAHLTGTPKTNHFLAEVKSGEANCISCHALNAKTGKIGLD